MDVRKRLLWLKFVIFAFLALKIGMKLPFCIFSGSFVNIVYIFILEMIICLSSRYKHGIDPAWTRIHMHSCSNYWRC